MGDITVIGLDLAKNVFQVHGADKEGRKLFNKQLNRKALLPFMATQPACLVGMEACGGAHYFAKKLIKLGHKVKMMSAQKVKPFIGSQKNDAVDAAGIAEAAVRKSIPAVPVKSAEILALQFKLRVRAQKIKQRTATVNQIRGFLMELGIVIAKGRSALMRALPDVLEDAENGLNFSMREDINSLLKEIESIDQFLTKIDRALLEAVKNSEQGMRFMTVPCVGKITAVAMMIELCDPAAFKNGRHFAAFLGLVPRQASSGGKTKLGKITKRGDTYVRHLLIHGARSVAIHCKKKDDKISRWVRRLYIDKSKNLAAVALANKTARTLWAIAASQENYRHVT